MKHYIIRLDDASDHMDRQKWKRMETLLDAYSIKPIFGIIPENRDDSLISKYSHDPFFWDMVHAWINKGWVPAMHGYEHRYVSREGGINPVNNRSEFAGLPYEEQARKIRAGYRILTDHDIHPDIFFAPSHTFDENTLKAIQDETPIRIISDTIAWDTYKKGVFWFIPQQSGRVRSLPFSTVTFCYHPNTMRTSDFETLEHFLRAHRRFFANVTSIALSDNRPSIVDRTLQRAYFLLRRH